MVVSGAYDYCNLGVNGEERQLLLTVVNNEWGARVSIHYSLWYTWHTHLEEF